MFSIGDFKAPGTDGLHAVFYKKFWSVVGDKVTEEVLNALNSRVIPEGWNDTAVVLIPKVDCPELISQFRPISLCNVVYKVISNVLSNRLKVLLPDIISPTQSAFVPGRLITDNALLAFECLHFIQHEKNPENSYCAYKLDLSKAYDRVDWGFLKQAMERMGFSHRWVQWIMTCVTTVRYTIKFNGTLLESFAPERGLRQGDPLSPFLFLFVADGLSELLKQGVRTNGRDPLKICRGAPGVSHLLFADDTLLFFKANQQQAEAV